MEEEIVSDTQPENGLYAGDPIRPGFVSSFLHAPGTQGRRHSLIFAVAVVLVAAIIVVGVLLFLSLSRQSQSYKDGYSVGGAVYAADAAAQLGARQACRATELRGPHHGGLPAQANATQWMKGCVAAFVLAQSGT
jgi:hypothetical protein